MTLHLFWLILVGACLTWYGTITIYIAVRGFADIREMLATLKKQQEQSSPGE